MKNADYSPVLNRAVGGGDPAVVGVAQANILIALDAFHAPRILDYGCGIGRTMPALYDALGRRPDIQIDGCDISDDFIQEARRLHATLPFRFFSISGTNPHYAMFGTNRSGEAIPAGYYDAAYSFSVFTHLTLPMAHETLSKVHGALRSGGYYYFTLFSLDSGAANVIRSNASNSFKFTNPLISTDVEYFADPLDALAFVALPDARVIESISLSGFEVVNFIPGAWRNISAPNIHDAFLVRKV
jgi:SAM-dependent methyltransferase